MLVILYLVLAKTLSPSELGIQYLQNEKGFSKVINKNNASVILIDSHETGFFMKTYYLKFRVITGYDTIDEVIVRTNKEFAKKNSSYIGLSLYRNSQDYEEFTPLPPGSFYIGNNEFGEWRTNDQGELVWKFKKPLKNLPKFLGWGNFVPNFKFYEQLKIKQNLGEPFFGLHNEFGSNGFITRTEFPQYFTKNKMKEINMKSLLFQYLKENF